MSEPSSDSFTTQSSTPGRASYDVLLHIIEWLDQDKATLYSCALVSRMFCEVAATHLYSKVTYSPAYSPVLDLKKRDELSKGFFASARLPHNSTLVRRLEISGYLSSRAPPLNKFSMQLRSAMESWPNLHTVIFAPSQYHENVFDNVLPLLLQLSKLRNLTINTSCCNENHIPTLSQLCNLESLTIYSPSRAVLYLLPSLLESLQPTLKTLQLMGSCGSVTPGVLRSFLPHMDEVSSFTLGLSYSLTDNDVFEFWQDLPNLRVLQFRYYLQMRPSIVPRLKDLRHLTVQYTDVDTREDAAYLYKWLRRAISQAPLESLHLVCDNEVSGAFPAFDSLVEHLYTKHFRTLRVLDMRDCFVGKRALKELCSRCTELEELSISITSDVLREFQAYSMPLRNLHSASFNVRKHKSQAQNLCRYAEDLILPNRALRRLSLNGVLYEGQWTSMPGDTLHFQVSSQEQSFPFP